MNLPHLASRLYGTPLLIAQPKLEVILAVLGERIGFAGSAANLAPPPSARPENLPERPGIAVIPVHGTLVRRTVGLEADSGLTSYQRIAESLEAALASPEVSGILLDIDSHGGESSGLFDLADRIHAVRQSKKIYAIANDHAFSAAYAIASAAERVFLTRTAGVGSIGVIAMHLDQSGYDADQGLRYTPVYAGARKNDLSPHEPISDQAHALLQGEVNRIYGLFVETVARQRNLRPAAVRATEAGVYFAQDAVAAGLADAVGTFEDALASLAEALTPRVVIARAVLPQSTLETAHSTISTPTQENTAMDETPHEPVEETIPASEPASQLPPEPEPEPEEPPTAPASVAAAATPSTPLTLADAQAIADLCQLAGCSDRTAAYLAAGASVAGVRRELLALQAQSGELSSRIVPDAVAAKPASLSDNPIVLAALKKSNQEK